jgi:hypothetical protein
MVIRDFGVRSALGRLRLAQSETQGQAAIEAAGAGARLGRHQAGANPVSTLQSDEAPCPAYRLQRPLEAVHAPIDLSVEPALSAGQTSHQPLVPLGPRDPANLRVALSTAPTVRQDWPMSAP